MPPALWAKWGSPDRAKRTGAAGSTDQVTPQDFAVVPISESSHSSWVTDKDSLANEAETKKASTSLTQRFSKAMKTTLGKVVHTKADNRNSDLLEHPELEIIPVKEGYRGLKAIERTIETMDESQRAKMATFPAQVMAELESQPMQSLSETSDEKQEASHGGASGTDSKTLENKKSFQPVGGKSSNRPVTPANLFNPPLSDPNTAATEQWATPASHLSSSPSTQTLERSSSNTNNDNNFTVRNPAH
ncbi:hypothetical protein CCHL11_03771 [Colletotrichum chlorophyti]|uniref:Uncharacterized protein n=1 Tax=Colletotrichum chlorophyti TaxID=708187 RepID=A0A1Q8RR70_9PEZI|nr:hypothetical protein CCHL11_03771 [Colletotrichum chlorophyti]